MHDARELKEEEDPVGVSGMDTRKATIDGSFYVRRMIKWSRHLLTEEDIYVVNNLLYVCMVRKTIEILCIKVKLVVSMNNMIYVY